MLYSPPQAENFGDFELLKRHFQRGNARRRRFFLRFWTSKTAIFKGETAKTGSKKIRILSENLIKTPLSNSDFWRNLIKTPLSNSDFSSLRGGGLLTIPRQCQKFNFTYPSLKKTNYFNSLFIYFNNTKISIKNYHFSQHSFDIFYI